MNVDRALARAASLVKKARHQSSSEKKIRFSASAEQVRFASHADAVSTHPHVRMTLAEGDRAFLLDRPTVGVNRSYSRGEGVNPGVVNSDFILHMASSAEVLGSIRSRHSTSFIGGEGVNSAKGQASVHMTDCFLAGKSGVIELYGPMTPSGMEGLLDALTVARALPGPEKFCALVTIITPDAVASISAQGIPDSMDHVAMIDLLARAERRGLSDRVFVPGQEHELYAELEN